MAACQETPSVSPEFPKLSAGAEITEFTEPMYEEIDGLPLLSMTGTCRECAKLTQLPPIPGTVLDMTAAFAGCAAVREVPDIPAGVASMEKAFLSCTGICFSPCRGGRNRV